MWDLPEPEIEPVSLALVGGFLTTGPPGKAGHHSYLGSNVGVLGFTGGSDSKESGCNVGDLDLIPVSGRSPEGGNGNPLQYSCLENPTDREA